MPGPLVGPGPSIPLPWWADPKGASVMDPLAVALARKAVGTAQTVGSKLGLNDPTNQLLMAAGGPIEGAEQDIWGSLNRHLKAQAADLAQVDPITGASNSMIYPTLERTHTGSSIPPPITGRGMLLEIVARHPDLEGVFDPTSMPGTMSRPPGFWAQRHAQARLRGLATPSPEEALTTKILKGGFDRPTATLEEVVQLMQGGQATPELSRTAAPTKPIGDTGPRYSQGIMRNRPALLKRAGLTEDDVRAIRTMSPKALKDAYPNVPQTTLTAVRSRDSFGWVPDK
jgi:hypothetical protein